MSPISPYKQMSCLECHLFLRGMSPISPETVSDERTIALSSKLKVGQFTFSQQDLVVPAGGQPLTVTRTYDSLNRRVGDFGLCWTYTLNDVELKLHETRRMVEDEYGTSYSIRDGGSRNVDITLPDGQRAVFAFAFASNTANPFVHEGVWKAPRGVKATLEPKKPARLVTLYGGMTYWEDMGLNTPVEAYEISGYILTMRDGTKYSIDRELKEEVSIVDMDSGSLLYAKTYQPAKMSRITTRSGARTEFTESSIDGYNPSGSKVRSVVFDRNAKGLITAIRSPKQLDANGNPVGPATIAYEYDGNDRLVKVNRLVDAATEKYETTQYLYGNASYPHLITEIKDPRGVSPMKSEYDESGRVVATVDAQGNRIAVTHDTAAKTETVFDRQGNPTIHSYDAKGNLVATTNALGGTTTHTFDADGNELSATDPLGHTTTYTYNERGDQTSVTDPLGNTTSSTYDSNGNPTSITDPLGNTTSYEYDSSGNILSTTDALGHKTTNRFDSNGNLTATYDAAGNLAASFGYNFSGDMISTTTANGVTRNFTYDADGLQTGSNFTYVDPETGALRPVSNSTVYDDAGRIVASVDSDGNTTTTEYNEIGKPIRSVDKLGNATITLYDDRGNMVEVQYPDGTVSRTVYDESGRITAVQDRHKTDEAANGARISYDAVGREIRSERLANIVVSVEHAGTFSRSAFVSADAVISAVSATYDAAGRVVKSVDSSGGNMRHEYDANGQVTADIDTMGNRVEHEYDAAGREVASIDALGRITQFENDAMDRLVRTVFADDTVAAVTYDELGRKASETNQAGVTKTFTYDPQGHLTAVALPEVPDPEAANTFVTPTYHYYYDTFGRLAKIADPKGRETKFTNDHLGRRTSRTLPMGQTESQQYDNLGRLAQKTDFKGQVTVFGYDGLGRISSQDFNGTANVNIAYDDLGRAKTITDSVRGNTTFSYDSEGRLANVASPEGGINYEYDAATGRKTRTWTANSDQRYTYDQLGRLKTVEVHKRNGAQLANPEVTTYNYTATGSRAGLTLPNGVSTEYSYDDLNRLRLLKHLDKNDQLLASYEYTLAPDGKRIAVQEKRLEADNTLSNTQISYGYDKLNRLVSEAATSTVASLNRNHGYVYDLVGNRLKKTVGAETIDYTYNLNDQLIQEVSNVNGGTDYQYDANGSLTSKMSGNGDSCSYAWDARNRMSAAQISRMEGASAVQVNAQYTYNHNGIRTRTVSSQTIQGAARTNSRIFLVDESNPSGYAQVMEELSSIGGAPVSSYTIGDEVVTQARNGQVAHLLRDGHGSTRLLSAPSGDIASRYDFAAYGEMVGGNPSVTNPAATDMLYSGEQFDSELQHQYLRARYYDQNNGRFSSIDPFVGNNDDPQSLHKYTYCHNNPVNLFDPSGLITAPWRIGQLAHTEIERIYENEHSGIIYTQKSLPGTTFMFPDIVDVSLKEIAEIKPLSMYGFATGPVQLQAYLAAANGFTVTYRGHTISMPPLAGGGWNPSTWQVGVRHVPINDPFYSVFTVGNLGGVIFYKAFLNPGAGISVAALAYMAKRFAQLIDAMQVEQTWSEVTAFALSHALDIAFTTALVASAIKIGAMASATYLSSGMTVRVMMAEIQVLAGIPL